MNQKISEETKSDAMRVAKATQKSGQSKEQTKLIAQGIEKGISEFKKQQKVKSRSRDKQKKLAAKNVQQADVSESRDNSEQVVTHSKLPWVLLVLSWLGFVGYTFFFKV